MHQKLQQIPFSYFISASFNNALNGSFFQDKLKHADINNQEMKKETIDL